MDVGEVRCEGVSWIEFGSNWFPISIFCEHVDEPSGFVGAVTVMTG
jgi:hypothetical protein